MNLEQRVQALENEVAVLKNQIQTTLLDIQSMLMTNAHPALRGEAGAPVSTWTDDTAPAAPPANALPVRKFSLEQVDDTDDDAELPAVRSVVQPAPPPPPVPAQRAPAVPVRQQVASQHAPARSARAAQVPPAPTQPSAMHLDVFEEPQEDERMAELRLWVLDKINDIGAQATIDELLAYSHSTYFSPEELNELINYAMECAEQQLAQSRPHISPAIPPAPTRAGRKAGIAPEASRNGKPSRIARVSPVDEDEHSAKRRTLLRLIAGVQNAGTSKWGKK